MPYSLETFTPALQDQFRIAVATSSSSGCRCTIAKEQVDITITSDAAEPPAAPARRLLTVNLTSSDGGASSISVHVSILMPTIESARSLVQSDDLSAAALNAQLAREGVAAITQMAVPVLHAPVLAVDECADSWGISFVGGLELQGIVKEDMEDETSAVRGFVATAVATLVPGLRMLLSTSACCRCRHVSTFPAHEQLPSASLRDH